MPVTLTQNSGDRAYGMPGFYRALVLTTDAICLHDKHHVNGTEGDHFTRGFSQITQTPTFAHGKVNCRSGELIQGKFSIQRSPPANSPRARVAFGRILGFSTREIKPKAALLDQRTFQDQKPW